MNPYDDPSPAELEENKRSLARMIENDKRRSGEMANGPVAKLASAADLKSADSLNHEGSIPSGATINPWAGYLVNGPYFHEDGRRFVILTKTSHIRKTTSYARYLMEVKLGRLLNDDEEVDHIDGDKRNDSLENLQILSKIDNIRKDIRKKNKTCKYGHIKDEKGICVTCRRARFKKWAKKTPRVFR